MLKSHRLQQINYDVLSDRVANVNTRYLRRYAVSPTIAEISNVIGETEESILESMEFSSRMWQ